MTRPGRVQRSNTAQRLRRGASNTGGLEVYNIRNNQITDMAFLGSVALSWQFSGVGNFSGHGNSDIRPIYGSERHWSGNRQMLARQGSSYEITRKCFASHPPQPSVYRMAKYGN
jgi:hypothetical protein